MKLVYIILLVLNVNIAIANENLENIIEFSYKKTSELKFDDIVIILPNQNIKLSFIKKDIADGYTDKLGRVSSSIQNIEI
ncbi:hypothetical protein [Rodentibacter myodis]|uniref:Uncharacterized protein n=1 Tax=Rodentibacter myodis TaxID=1907939 RepID=A0A1V3JG75_9PAST|nr:hypothetical protein [Rodentibacter myodis]OOF55427.1 hypothetical protein BKL49_11675 [Rodentibacter myodis]